MGVIKRQDLRQYPGCPCLVVNPTGLWDYETVEGLAKDLQSQETVEDSSGTIVGGGVMVNMTEEDIYTAFGGGVCPSVSINAWVYNQQTISGSGFTLKKGSAKIEMWVTSEWVEQETSAWTNTSITKASGGFSQKIRITNRCGNSASKDQEPEE